MRPRLGGDKRDRTAVERDAIEPGAKDVVFARDEPDLSSLHVDCGDGIDGPVTLGEGANQVPILVVQLEVLETGPFRGPDERAGLADRMKVVVEIDPGVGLLFEQESRLAGAGVDAKEAEQLLVAKQALDKQV